MRAAARQRTATVCPDGGFSNAPGESRGRQQPTNGGSNRLGKDVIVASVILALVGCATLVLGVRESSASVAYISLGCSVVAGAVLVMSVRARSAVKGRRREATVAEEPQSPPTYSAQSAVFDQTVADAWAESSAPTPVPEPTDAYGSRFATVVPPLAPPTLLSMSHLVVEPVLGLKTPGPAVIGRLRRRPFGGSDNPRPGLATPAEEIGPRAHRSNGEACSAAPRPKSHPRPVPAEPKRTVAGSKRSGVTKARVPPGPSTNGKTVARKAAGTAAASGVRQASRNGAGPAKRTPPQRQVAEK